MALILKHLKRPLLRLSRNFSTQNTSEHSQEEQTEQEQGKQSKPEDFRKVACADELLGGPPDLSRFRKDMEAFHLPLVTYDPEAKDFKVSEINTKDYFAGRRSIFVGIIGAFEPECNDVVYDWARAARAFKKNFKFDDVVCVGVNDAYVMQHYARKLGYEDRVSFLADWKGEFSQFMESYREIEDFGKRGTRYSSVVMYGRLKVIFSSAQSKLFYFSGVAPTFLWRKCASKKYKSRIFL